MRHFNFTQRELFHDFHISHSPERSLISYSIEWLWYVLSSSSRSMCTCRWREPQTENFSSQTQQELFSLLFRWSLTFAMCICTWVNSRVKHLEKDIRRAVRISHNIRFIRSRTFGLWKGVVFALYGIYNDLLYGYSNDNVIENEWKLNCSLSTTSTFLCLKTKSERVFPSKLYSKLNSKMLFSFWLHEY